MSKKLFALLLLAAAGSSVNAGAKMDKAFDLGLAGLTYTLDAIWVVKPAAHIKDEGKRNDYLDKFESTKLAKLENWKRKYRLVGIPYNIAFGTGAAAAVFFSGKGINNKIQILRKKRAAKKALANKELAA